jgi:hypothetical protein
LDRFDCGHAHIEARAGHKATDDRQRGLVARLIGVAGARLAADFAGRDGPFS